MTGTSRAVLITTKALSRHYPSGDEAVLALDRVDLEIRQGEFVAVLGPSGCGKSTLLSILGLLEDSDAGSYVLAGVDSSTLDFDRRSELRNQNIGLIFQAFNLIADMTVAENIGLPLRYSTVPGSEHADRIAALAQRVGLADRMHHFPHQLSGGQQQRVSIARAMVTGPALILADEPTGNLDTRHALEVMALIKEFHDDGATVILVTHDEKLAVAADRRLHMIDGRISAES